MENEIIFSDSFKEVFQFWKNLDRVEGSILPAKSSIHPKNLVGKLERVAIFEYFGPTKAMVRISGTALDKFLGRNVTGENMFDYFDEGNIKRYQKVNEELIHGSNGVISLRKINSPKAKSEMTLRSIGLPLNDKDGISRFIFAFYEFDKVIGKNLLTEFPAFEKFETFDYRIFDLNTGDWID